MNFLDDSAASVISMSFRYYATLILVKLLSDLNSVVQMLVDCYSRAYKVIFEILK